MEISTTMCNKNDRNTYYKRLIHTRWKAVAIICILLQHYVEQPRVIKGEKKPFKLHLIYDRLKQTFARIPRTTIKKTRKKNENWLAQVRSEVYNYANIRSAGHRPGTQIAITYTQLLPWYIVKLKYIKVLLRLFLDVW